MKLINRILPTWANMRVMFPDIYLDSICKLCNQKEETIQHLTICDYFQESWNIIKLELSKYIKNQIIDLWDISIDTKLIIGLFHNTIVDLECDRSMLAWLLGFISKSRLQYLVNLLKSYNKARKVAVMIMDKLQIIFREDIWTGIVGLRKWVFFTAILGR